MTLAHNLALPYKRMKGYVLATWDACGNYGRLPTMGICESMHYNGLRVIDSSHTAYLLDHMTCKCL